MAPSSPFTPTSEGVRVRLYVKPGASRTLCRGVVVQADGTGALALAVAAPPVDGAANEAVIAFLAKAWGLPKSRLHLLSGASSRHKLVFVSGADLAGPLERWLATFA